ncbi:MAG: alpha/beta fold hydrolase [Solirubrobacteraceae bacterium]
MSLHCESTGDGPPVLLVMGLGMNATGWWRTVPVLADAGLRVLAFDNRGVGRSLRTPGPYTVAQMARDAVSVLDAAGVESAHVYGISLGGMIAQEVALRHPGRVRSLVLGATTPGGAAHVPPGEDVLALLRLRAQMTAEHAVWASVPINYSPATRSAGGDRIAQDIAQRLRFPVEPEYYVAQRRAAEAHDAADRLGGIDAPVLVVHGDQDVLIVPENARRLAAAIPGAELRMWPGAAHLYFTDDPQIDRDVAAWLSGRSSPGPS